MLLKRDQLKVKAKAKGKDAGEDGDDSGDDQSHGARKTPTGKGKGRGRGRGRGRGKSSKRAADDDDEDESGAPKNKKGKVSEEKDGDGDEPGTSPEPREPQPSVSKPKPRAKAKAKTTKGVEKGKSKAKAKASPKSDPKPKRKSRRSPAGPADANEVEQEESPPADKVPYEPAVMMSELPSLENELIFQFKSGKTLLKGNDFPEKNFSRSSVSAYYTRARPTVGLKTKIKTTRTNKEFCHFSFSLTDALNIGLAMRCALLTVSHLVSSLIEVYWCYFMGYLVIRPNAEMPFVIYDNNIIISHTMSFYDI